MKNMRKIIALLVAIIAGAIYVSDTYLDIDLIGMFVPDTAKPIIDTDELNSKVQLGGTVDLTVVTCTDNRDNTCTVEIEGSVNTDVLDTYTISFSATDEAGNTSYVNFDIEVIEGLDTTMYVPAGYYDGIEGLEGEALKNALNDIVTGHHELPYTDKDGPEDVWRMLRAGDEDPNNADNIIMFYSGISWSEECQDTRTDLLDDECFYTDREGNYTEWNREHIWSKSHGDFTEENEPEGAHTDGHHLVAADRRINSTKNNRFFNDCQNSSFDNVEEVMFEEDGVDVPTGNYICGEWYFEPRDEIKGDVARMLFYMAVRYEGEDGDYVDLELTTDLYLYEDLETAIKNSKLPYYENLEVLLQWHIDDPVDEWELERNETIYQFQGNRNPFIDHPELVALIWGTPDNPIEYVSTTAE